MNKNILLIIATASLFSCMQAIKSTPKTVGIETINTVRNYEYADAMGKQLIIQNSGPKGMKYTDPNGKEYSKIIFWTRIINETEKPFELNIDLPIHSYEVPTLPGKYFKILVPSDTMKLDQEPLQDYGMKNLKSYLDNNIHKPSSLKRTIHPKESSGVYFIILFDKGVPGPTRTGLSIRGKNLFYKISRYDSTPAHALVDEKEINCGSVNLNLKSLK